MIWHYFPIGMRFPVADFTEDTKRACWKVALNAAFCCDVTQTGLYEACESFDPMSQSPVYTCIICFVGIKQSRTAGDTLHSMDTLLTRLCLHKPLIQANDLENFGPYPILAEIDGAGTVRPTETGAPFIPTEPPTPMQQCAAETILIALPFTNGCEAERLSRMIGIAATERGFRVRRMMLADGGKGTVRALVAGTGGRYDTVVCEDVNGENTRMMIGVIPGGIAVIETEDAVGLSLLSEKTTPSERSSACVGTLIKKTLDLGFRNIWIGLGESSVADLGFGALHALGMRFADAEGEPVVPCCESVQRIAQVDRSGLDPRLAETELTVLCASETTLCIETPVSALGGDPTAPVSGAAGGLGFALCSVGGKLVPGVQTIRDRIKLADALTKADFYIGGSELDPKELTRAYPNLKGAAACPTGEEESDDTIRAMFERSVLPAFGKGVVNGLDL